MFRFVQMQYRLGRISRQQVLDLVPQVLTSAEAARIVGV